MENTSHNGTGVMLMALCASYINSATRLKHFFVMLTSWITQNNIQCSLIISTSIVDERLLREFETMIKEFKQTHAEILDTVYFRILISRKQMPQFKHYKNIMDHYPELVDTNPWILFTDDDDIWHPNRTWIYHTAIEHIISTHRTDIEHVYCPYYVQSTGADKKDYATAADIDMAIKNGDIQQSKCDTNYVHSCVRLERLYYFLTRSTDELLTCMYADVKFSFFMQSDGSEKGQQSLAITAPWDDGWMYFYRHVSDPDGSITNKKGRLPDGILYSPELDGMLKSLPIIIQTQLVTILASIELLICTGKSDLVELKRENERIQLDHGVPARFIKEVIRPLYTFVDEFLKHSYYVNLMKKIV